jgi:hypothetical protein
MKRRTVEAVAKIEALQFYRPTKFCTKSMFRVNAPFLWLTGASRRGGRQLLVRELQVGHEPEVNFINHMGGILVY